MSVNAWEEEYVEMRDEVVESLANHFDISDEQARDAWDAILAVLVDYGAVTM